MILYCVQLHLFMHSHQACQLSSWELMSVVLSSSTVCVLAELILGGSLELSKSLWPLTRDSLNILQIFTKKIQGGTKMEFACRNGGFPPLHAEIDNEKINAAASSGSEKPPQESLLQLTKAKL